MVPRNQKSWESFKPTGGRFEDRQRPSFFSTWLGYLLALAFMLPVTYWVSRFIYFRFFRLFTGRRLLPYLIVVGGAVAFAIYHWIHGIREEIKTRKRIDNHRSRPSMAPWKARPPMCDEAEDEERL